MINKKHLYLKTDPTCLPRNPDVCGLFDMLVKKSELNDRVAKTLKEFMKI
jgi:hypothetical protein